MVGAVEATLIGAAVTFSANNLKSLAESVIERNSGVGQKLILLECKAQRVQERLGQLLISRDSDCKSWLRKLMEWCYDMNDIIDEVELAKMRRCGNQSYKSITPSSRWFNWLLPMPRIALPSSDSRWNLKVTMKVNKLLDKFECLEELMNSLNIGSHSQEQNNCWDPNNQELPAVPDALSLPSGRKIDKKNVINKLLDEDIHGVSIIGMAGLGKSVLARSIALDEMICRHFHRVLWASPRMLLESTEPYVLSESSEPVKTTHNQCAKTLWVLDSLDEALSDMESSYIESFRSSMHVNKGDKLLITSRDPRVARLFKTAPYYLKRMSNKDCEQLIKYTLRHKLSENERVFLKATASDIANKCMGLPLAACVLGRELYARRWHKGGIEEAIRSLDKPELWKKLRARILRALRLDDQRLVRHWNKLVYFTLFPHDLPLSKDNLVQHWMAEGFVQSEEWIDWDSTEKHFSDMLPTSMVEPSSNESPEKDPPTYQTNEIAHTFAHSMSGNLCFRVDTGEESPFPGTRHLSLCGHNTGERLHKEIAIHCKRLRTLLLLHSNGSSLSQVPRFIFQKLVRLRVLDLSHSGITFVPSSISNLKHLRYLDLSHNADIELLPDTICELFGLVILKLLACSKLRKLPKKFGNLVNLTHLELDETSSCCLPQKLGNLTKLQTLYAFPVEKDDGCPIAELKDLNALGGSIRIMQLENVKDGKEAAQAALDKKPDLRILSLEWTKLFMPEPSIAEDILNQLNPHRNLVEVRVTNYSGEIFPWWISNSLCESIHLDNCPGITRLPPFWELPLLKTLHIESIWQLESIGRDFFGDRCHGGFRLLESLTFCKMGQLWEFQGLLPGDMPSLRELKFDSCPHLTVLPPVQPLPRLTQLEIIRCPGLRIERALPTSLKEYRFEGYLIPCHKLQKRSSAC